MGSNTTFAYTSASLHVCLGAYVYFHTGHYQANASNFFIDHYEENYIVSNYSVEGFCENEPGPLTSACHTLNARTSHNPVVPRL